MVESLVNAAVEIGLPEDAATELVLQTMLGSAKLLEQSGRGAAELRRGVTSPGGTTEQAIRVFEAGNFASLVRVAVRVAYDRARELGS